MHMRIHFWWLLFIATIVCLETTLTVVAITDVESEYKKTNESEPILTVESLHDAVDNLDHGESIQISAGSFQLKKLLIINTDGVTIKGAGGRSTVIICPNGQPAFQIEGVSVKVSNILIRGCESYSAMRIGRLLQFMFSPVSLYGSDHSVKDLSSKNEGSRTSVTIHEVIFDGNRLTSSESFDDSGGAINAVNSDVEIISSLFVKNFARGDGGAVQARNSSVRIRKTLFKLNEAKGFGGAIYTYDGGRLIMLRCKANNNTGGVSGGAIYSRESVLISIRRSAFEKNVATYGGAMAVILSKEVALYALKVNFNTATKAGGALYLDVILFAQIESSLFSDNEAGSYGGVFRLYETPLLLSKSEMRNNHARQGGVIFGFSSSAISLLDSNFTNNRATTDPDIFLDDGLFEAYSTYIRCRCESNSCLDDIYFDPKGEDMPVEESEVCPPTECCSSVPTS